MPTATRSRTAPHRGDSRKSSPPWIPRWARLRGPRVRLTHQDVHHHTFSTMVGLFLLWSVWLCCAMLVCCALVYWWIGLAMFLAGRWVVFAAITAYGDRRG